ncbi:TspA protein [Neisseria sp. HMSC064F04]|uniref:FimV/HubP family polar landmark protein n=1 Tax=Neisseria mucosa TaxID=488 RepID=UPI0008A22596|nr:FimV/HubP family polar landmark protein [Neisseria mucosa]OFN06159.1 TspA protein [Neisseria sp. HMSC055F11]OFN33446.1 TspA protein [Neisseria sp. HMSC059F02]OHR39970.1 TspA protein [Neisseria sp. HMSC064F04]
MKKHYKIKLIAASVALAVSVGASAGLGGLNVQSHLGEPFSGNITVTGEEAQALFNGGKASVSNANLRTSVHRAGDRAVINIRSAKAIKDPVLIFQVSTGSQSREYTAIIDPADYSVKGDSTPRVRQEPPPAYASQQIDRQAARERINRALRSGNASADVANNTRKEGIDNKKSKNTQTQPKQTQNATSSVQGEPRYGKRHLVKQGETLTEIATRIRPQGMTVEQAIQALVKANPSVFINKNADHMLAGKVLNIPTQFDMKQAAAKQAAEKPLVSDKQQPQTAAASKASSEKSEAAKTNASAENKAGENKAGEEAKSNKEAKLEQQPAQVTASAPQGATQEQAASSVGTEEVLQPGIAEQTAASETAKSTPEAQVEEALAAQQNSAAQSEAVEESSEDGGLWRWLLIGGGALLALLLLLKALGKRKAAAVAPVVPVPSAGYDEEDDDISFAETVIADEAKPEQFVQAKAVPAEESDGLSIEDDFDDEAFFVQPNAAKEAAEDEININIDDIDDKHVGIVSSAVTVDEETEKRRDLDWDSVESTESVYEPEPENPYQPVSIVIESRHQDEAVEEPDNTAHIRQFDEVQSNFDTSSHDANEETKEADAPVGEEEYSYTEPAVVEEVSDLEFDYEASEAQQQERTVGAEDVKGVEEAEEGWDFFSEKIETQPIEPLPEFTTSKQTSSEKLNEDEALEFASVDTAADETVAEEPFEIKQDEGIIFQESDEDFGLADSQGNEVEETIEWENLTVDEEVSKSALDSGFISESVGMTAPLEAKYELAKMYVEIGDPGAARETLQELMEEATGDILDKTKALLAELG